MRAREEIDTFTFRLRNKNMQEERILPLGEKKILRCDFGPIPFGISDVPSTLTTALTSWAWPPQAPSFNCGG
jgi:hypothetical protein